MRARANPSKGVRGEKERWEGQRQSEDPKPGRGVEAERIRRIPSAQACSWIASSWLYQISTSRVAGRR